MILYKGNVYDNIKQIELIASLKDDCYQTLKENEGIKAVDVIEACDKLAKKVRNKEFDHIIKPLLDQLDISYQMFENYIYMFEKDALMNKCEIELGKDFNEQVELNKTTTKTIEPLGILFHIAAGNVDALPAYSVIEGLLAGNINILKLPSGDSGLSIILLHELINLEPKLKDYIYVFDVPSTELDTLQTFANIADGVVVWGGDVAVKAAKQMASNTTKVIAWGHKLSFGYATLNASDKDLEGLAHHVCQTNQLLCSSAQGIFVDTNDLEELEKFGKRFFEIFVKINKENHPLPLGVRGKNTLELYANHLEKQPKTFYAKDGVSVIVLPDSDLVLSKLFRNVWIKPLPKENIIDVIKPHKNHLQTVGLMCGKEESEELIKILKKTGVTRITKGIDMARYYVGESHDGTYALREYTRVVENDRFQ
ncbi:MAG: acyl-CoA reductase [Acholeplasma sp.]|nr:acyl-CoA reductase [Acholeplasma sp.]